MILSLSVLFPGSRVLPWSVTQGSAWETLKKRMEQSKRPLSNFRSGKHLTSSTAGMEGEITALSHPPKLLGHKRADSKGSIFHLSCDKGTPFLGKGANTDIIYFQTVQASKLLPCTLQQRDGKCGKRGLVGLCSKPRAQDKCQGPSPPAGEGILKKIRKISSLEQRIGICKRLLYFNCYRN